MPRPFASTSSSFTRRPERLSRPCRATARSLPHACLRLWSCLARAKYAEFDTSFATCFAQFMRDFGHETRALYIPFSGGFSAYLDGSVMKATTTGAPCLLQALTGRVSCGALSRSCCQCGLTDAMLWACGCIRFEDINNWGKRSASGRRRRSGSCGQPRTRRAVHGLGRWAGGCPWRARRSTFAGAKPRGWGFALHCSAEADRLQQLCRSLSLSELLVIAPGLKLQR